eukprot:SAG25_NODE_148_length_13769_cov_14.642648_10_plen_97_part_00
MMRCLHAHGHRCIIRPPALVSRGNGSLSLLFQADARGVGAALHRGAHGEGARQHHGAGGAAVGSRLGRGRDHDSCTRTHRVPPASASALHWGFRLR